jgi:hypothetical protein
MIDAIKKPLVTLVEFRLGYPFRGAIESLASGSVAVIQMKDVSLRGAMVWDAVVRTELTGRREPDWLASGDVLFVARGNHYYAAALAGVPNRSICGPHLYHLRLKRNSAVLPGFLAWQINQPPIQRLLRQAAEGSNQLSIRRAELEALPISVPSLIDQEHIVRLAEAAGRERALLDQLILNRERQLSALAFALADAAGHPNN